MIPKSNELTVVRLANGKDVPDAVYEDCGNVLNSHEYVSLLHVDGVKHRSVFTLPAGINPKFVSFMRYTTDNWNFMNLGFMVDVAL